MLFVRVPAWLIGNPHNSVFISAPSVGTEATEPWLAAEDTQSARSGASATLAVDQNVELVADSEDDGITEPFSASDDGTPARPPVY
jgi:hypothetical protein